MRDRQQMFEWNWIGIRGLAAILLAMVMMLTVRPMNLLAAGTISSVAISVSEEIEVGGEANGDGIFVTANSDKYYVDDVEVLNENLTWGPLDAPVIQVTIYAEDEYTFSVKASDISVKGAEYLSGRRTDHSDCLILVLRLPSLANQVGEIEAAQWGSGTVGTWEEAYNAGQYEIYLYRDGQSAGKWQNVKGNSCDFGSRMGRAGTYSFKVRALNMRDAQTKSEWREAAGTVTVDAEQARQLRSQYGLELPEGVNGPGEAAAYLEQKNRQYGWILDSVGWWYRNADDSYTTNNWQLIDGKWYYFDSVGYMVTGWIDWNGNSYYCSPGSGEMLVSTVVPDGSGRRVDSSGAWIR